MDPNVGVLWLFPGIQKKVVENFLKPPLKGVVLLAFGEGNGPVSNKQFLNTITNAIEKYKITIVDCTQCMKGTVSLDDYATGTALRDAGVISGFDMTTEAAFTKLSYLLGRYPNKSNYKRQIQEDLRGELAKPSRQKPLPAHRNFSYN